MQSIQLFLFNSLSLNSLKFMQSHLYSIVVCLYIYILELCANKSDLSYCGSCNLFCCNDNVETSSKLYKYKIVVESLCCIVIANVCFSTHSHDKFYYHSNEIFIYMLSKCFKK